MEHYTISQDFTISVRLKNKETGVVRVVELEHTWFCDILEDITDAMTDYLEGELDEWDFSFSRSTIQPCGELEVDLVEGN